MTTPFGPQLVGETEKTLTALLRGFLAETGLTEPQWVTLRVAQIYGAGRHRGARRHCRRSRALSRRRRARRVPDRSWPAGRRPAHARRTGPDHHGAGNERARDRCDLARSPCRRRRGHDPHPQRGPRTFPCSARAAAAVCMTAAESAPSGLEGLRGCRPLVPRATRVGCRRCALVPPRHWPGVGRGPSRRTVRRREGPSAQACARPAPRRVRGGPAAGRGPPPVGAVAACRSGSAGRTAWPSPRPSSPRVYRHRTPRPWPGH